MRRPFALAALTALLFALPASANEFKLGLQLDEGGPAIPREAALAATADQRRTCASAATEDCALELIAAADMLATAGAFTEAEASGRAAVAIMEKLRGRAHPDTSVAYGTLGSVLLRAGRYDAAEPVLRAALLGLEASAGSDPELLSDHLMNLGIVLAEQRRFDLAEPPLRRALAVRLEKLPENLLAIATVRANLAVLLDRMGRRDEAMTQHQAALVIRRDRLKGSDYDLGTSMLNLAEALAQSRDAARLLAEPYLRAGLMTREAVLTPGDPRTTFAQTMLAENLQAQGKGAAAMELYIQAYAGARQGSEADSPLRIRAGWNLARFLTITRTGLPLARTLYRDAAAGALARVDRAQDFNERARADLDRYRGVFTGEIGLAWTLAKTQ